MTKKATEIPSIAARHLHPLWVPLWDIPTWHTCGDATRAPLWDIRPWKPLEMPPAHLGTCHHGTFETYHHSTLGRCHQGTSLGHKTTASLGHATMVPLRHTTMATLGDATTVPLRHISVARPGDMPSPQQLFRGAQGPHQALPTFSHSKSSSRGPTTALQAGGQATIPLRDLDHGTSTTLCPPTPHTKVESVAIVIHPLTFSRDHDWNILNPLAGESHVVLATGQPKPGGASQSLGGALGQGLLMKPSLSVLFATRMRVEGYRPPGSGQGLVTTEEDGGRQERISPAAYGWTKSLIWVEAPASSGVKSVLEEAPHCPYLVLAMLAQQMPLLLLRGPLQKQRMLACEMLRA